MHSYTFVYVYYNAIIQKYNYGVNRGSVFFLGGNMRSDIGKIIKKFRVMKGVSQAQLAAELGTAASAMSAYETGTKIPKIELREQIAKALEVDPVELSGLELSRDDEIRLLMKLLSKYATSITTTKNSSGEYGVDVTLPYMFSEFSDIYMEHCRDVDKISDDYKKSGDMGEYLDNAKRELEFWIDMWPDFDFTYQVDNDRIDPFIRSHHSAKELLRSKFLSKYFDYLNIVEDTSK